MTAHQYTEAQLVAMLRGKNLKASDSRIAILGYILSSEMHPTADTIYNALSADHPSLSRATVYNCVRALADAGLINEVGIDTYNQRFDSALERPHAHFACRMCGRVIDIAYDMSSITIPAGFESECVNLNFKGICPECQSKHID